MTLPDAPIFTLSLNPAPLSALSTKTRPSRNGEPMLSENSVGAAPVPPSEPSTVMKSKFCPVSTIAFTIATNSQGWPMQSLMPTGLLPDKDFNR